MHVGDSLTLVERIIALKLNAPQFRKHDIRVWSCMFTVNRESVPSIVSFNERELPGNRIKKRDITLLWCHLLYYVFNFSFILSYARDERKKNIFFLPLSFLCFESLNGGEGKKITGWIFPFEKQIKRIKKKKRIIITRLIIDKIYISINHKIPIILYCYLYFRLLSRGIYRLYRFVVYRLVVTSIFD